MNNQEGINIKRLIEMLNMSILGNRIKEARESLHFTQDDLGKSLGVTGLTVSRWETDKAYPRIQQLENASRILSRPIYWFFLPYELDKAIVDEDDLITLCDLYRSLNATGKAKLLSTAADLSDLTRYR